MAVAGDDAGAVAAVARFVERIGYDPPRPSTSDRGPGGYPLPSPMRGWSSVVSWVPTDWSSFPSATS